MTNYLPKENEDIQRDVDLFTKNAERLAAQNQELVDKHSTALGEDFILKVVVDKLIDVVMGPKIRESDGFLNSDRLSFEIELQTELGEIMRDIMSQSPKSSLILPPKDLGSR